MEDTKDKLYKTKIFHFESMEALKDTHSKSDLSRNILVVCLQHRQIVLSEANEQHTMRAKS